MDVVKNFGLPNPSGFPILPSTCPISAIIETNSTHKRTTEKDRTFQGAFSNEVLHCLASERIAKKVTDEI
jgi:hypothetical protein